MPMCVVQRVLAYSVCLAERASSIVRHVVTSGQLGIVQKQNENDLQTDADRCVQRCIVAGLGRHFPRLTVIAEEDLSAEQQQQQEEQERPLSDTSDCSAGEPHSSHQQQQQQLMSPPPLPDANSTVHQQLADCPSRWQDVTEEQIVVWVDPLDGTKEFTQGLLDHVTVLIGLAVDGAVAAGVVGQPYHNYTSYDQPAECPGRVLYSLVGTGVVHGGLRPHTLPPPDHATDTTGGGDGSGGVITTTRSHSTGLVRDTLAAMQPQRVVAVGGAGHKVLLLLEGGAHAYVFASPGCKKWDTCAPQALLETIGGRLTDICGAPLPYAANAAHANSGGVLATAPGLSHQWYVDRVPASVRQSLSSPQQ